MPQLNSKNKDINRRIQLKRFRKRVARKQKKERGRRIYAESQYGVGVERRRYIEEEFGSPIDYRKVLKKWLSTNLLYILSSRDSQFKVDSPKNRKNLRLKKVTKEKFLYIPETFSLIEEPKESYEFLNKSINALLFGNYEAVYFNYNKCRKLDVGAQVVLDIIKKEARAFITKCERYKIIRKINAANNVGFQVDSADDEIMKILLSVGSFAVQSNIKSEFKDIIPYRLCHQSREDEFDIIQAIEQKNTDTTDLADYVIDSLARMNKKLTGEKLDDLCKIIGEILINAEEHSTTKHRFSIGYFQDKRIGNKHLGVFRLVILNFGKTIYETFSESDNPNQKVIKRMKELSEKYTKNKFFTGRKFEEENLWTLYALQQGVTSIPDNKRGTGSIEFIDSFFSIKGEEQIADEKSRMTILSGNTKITFDGTYRITEKIIDGQNFKTMTFNNSGNIEDEPDKKFVQYTENYFPGALISARIYLNEDDFI